ncbi:hypothetical protein SXCC_02325 [Gluconacetobacter sp. SXCC-1]|uniref:Uncharacterized protein n=1 Tax=Komagataeibacter rhaeticus TaxID=215221 RepID=A0A181CA08_9PROT|nr:hypothetical protein [Komagataeibacter rhaeticus]ATU73060.1 hypothetical protein CT154_09655 [Komagataeibacter xylinus]EGG77113.1 hypothetical protein SXCC_02325 [Gluconacetobacter sp. SXCC-1]QIP35193.1 hypothetical protein GWK63_06700 [Komagataeibacter rhaeticus]QOC47755.1 hypothetical protein ICJ78_06755 [Komagataeibacter rhaeticus]WPP22881.1 hypothetical protein SCD25_05175 [Komagataeibacter rhaeticus]
MAPHVPLRADAVETIILTHRQYNIVMDFKEIEGLRGIWERMGRVRANPAATQPDLWLHIDTDEYLTHGLLLYCPMATGADGVATFDLDGVLMVLDRYEQVNTIPGWLAPERTLSRIDSSMLKEDETHGSPVEYD